MARSKTSAAKRSQLRIIGGQWRGRKLFFTPEQGLRPTPDRVRETLFNWLSPEIHGAHCLDLFAGSGALGLEALSRGAAHCTFVDTSDEAIEAITSHLRAVEAADQAACLTKPAEQVLLATERKFNIAFLDPPYQQGLIEPSAALLQSMDILSPGALVYVETHASEALPKLPSDWNLRREKRAGDVAYRLFELTG